METILLVGDERGPGVLARLRRAGFTDVAALSLEAPLEALSVVRVVVPQMHVSELL